MTDFYKKSISPSVLSTLYAAKKLLYENAT